MDPIPDKTTRKKPVLLIVIVIVLAGAVAFLGYTYLQLKKQSEIERAELTRQREQLESELMDIYGQYDSLKTENDTINLKLQAEQERIERLLKINANNVYKIRMYERELETIRKVLRSYVVQIDSLNTLNQQLRADNITVRTQLKQVETEKETLAQEKDMLSGKVQLASVLSASDIVVVGLTGRSREVDRIRRIAKLRCCFTIRENPVVDPGPKTVYMRITRPDGVVLQTGMNFFEFEGEQLIYSASREVSYENKDVELCIYWNNDGQLIPGNYKVELYCEGALIGESIFALR